MNGHLFQTSMDPSSMTHSNTSSSNNMLMRMMMENSEANANVKNNIINNNDINVTTYHNVINTSSMSLSPSSSSSTITNGLNSKGSSDHGNGGNIANISNGNNKNSYSGSLSNQNVQDKTIEVLSNHQQGSMPLGKVKRSCEECSRAKVKCSSSLPKCIRCNDRKITCVYVEEMRRGRRDILLRTSPSSDTRDIQAPDSLNVTDLIKSSDSVSTPNTGCSSISTSSAKALNEITSATTTTISPTTFQLYRIVNGTPETVSRVLPVKVAQPKRDKSQTSKSFKAESLKKEKESKPSKKQKVASTDEKKKKDDNPNVNFVDSSRATPEQMDIQKTDNLAAVNNNNNINGNNMSKQELRMVEKKIFSIFCELSNHIKISSGTCVCGGFIPLSQQKMNHYLFMTDQLSHYMDLSKDIEQQIILMNPPSSSSSPSSSSAATSNSFQRLDISYTSLDELDIVNNIDDRFTVAPAMSPSQGLKFENSSYKAYIERLSNPSNPIPYYRLDCITSLVVDGQILSPSNQGRSISTVTPFINEAFSNTFGYSPALITWFHQHLQGGLLPFGGDILTLLMNDLKSIRRCLHRITVKTRHSLSMVQSQLIPNSSLCQTFETQFSIGNAENPLQLVHRNNKGSVINCICQILFRNVILPDMSSAGTQMHVSFVPVHIMSIPKEINTQTNQIQYPQSDMQTQPQGHNRNHNHAQIQSIPQQGIQIRQGYGHPPNTSNQVFMNNPQSNFPPYSGNQQQQMLNFQQQQIHNQQPGNHQQISQMHRNFKQGIPDSIPFTVLPNNHAMVNQTEALFKDDLIDQITSSSPAPFQSLFSPSSNPKLFQFDEA